MIVHSRFRGATAGVLAGIFAIIGSAGLGLGVGALQAQKPASNAGMDKDIAAMVTAADLKRHLDALAADSLQGRTTPSPALERTARYVAAQFERAGLQPFSALLDRAIAACTVVKSLKERCDNVSLTNATFIDGRRVTTTMWFQRYFLPFQLDLPASAVVFTAGSQRVSASFATAARLRPYVFEHTLNLHAQPAQPRKVVLVAGHHTAASVAEVAQGDQLILYIPPAASTMDAWGAQTNAYGVDSTKVWNPGPELLDSSQAMLILSDEDSAVFARRREAHRPLPLRQPNTRKWSVFVRTDGVPGLRALLAAAGVDLARLRADSTRVVRELPALEIALAPRFREPPVDTMTAPNVAGVLEGSDPKLKDEYIIVAAHMDQPRAVPVDPSARGPGVGRDNAAGVAGLLALAEALSRPEARPRRSVIFVATSGGTEPSFWGSTAFIEKLVSLEAFGPGTAQWLVPVAAALTLDLFGRPVGDSVALVGLGDMDWGVSPALLAMGHPELDLTVTDGGTMFDPHGGHFAFAGNPLLLLPTLGIETRGSPVSAANTAEQSEALVRVVRLAAYVGQSIANVERHPRLNEAGRRVVLREP